MLIDAHCHVGPEGSALDGSRAFSRYLRRARACGIEHIVLMSAIGQDARVGNRRVYRWVERLGRDRVTGLAYVHARRDRGRIHALVREAVDSFGFHGIKVHRLDARLTAEICDVAEEFGLPVLYDPNAEIAPVEALVPRYPAVRFIVPHLGSFYDDIRSQVRVIRLLRDLPNLYCDTSGMRSFDLLREAVAYAGCDRFLFGSDGPYLHPAVELEKVRLLGLTGGDLQKVQWQNAYKVYRPCSVRPSLVGGLPWPAHTARANSTRDEILNFR